MSDPKSNPNPKEVFIETLRTRFLAIFAVVCSGALPSYSAVLPHPVVVVDDDCNPNAPPIPRRGHSEYPDGYPFGEDGDLDHPDGYDGWPGDTPPNTPGAPPRIGTPSG